MSTNEFNGVWIQEYAVMVPVERYGETEEEMHGAAQNDDRLVGTPYAEAVELAEKLGGRIVELGPMREIGE